MKLNFMHILAKLGFGEVYPVYWIKESKACHRIYILSKNACTRLLRTKGKYNLDKTPSKPRSTQKCNPMKGYPNYI